MKLQLKTAIISVICVIAIFLLLYFALNLLSDQDYSEDDKANQNQAVEIIDGDTFRTKAGETIRLLCVDTPEKNQEGYDKAVEFLGARLFYSDIKLEGNKTDKYNRSLRWVYVDGVLVNKEIIDLGLGTLFEYEGENCSLVKD